MNKRLLLLFLVAVLTPAQAEQSGDAEALYDQHCIQCHGSEVYTRADRKVTSLDALQRQVRRCELALGLKWFDEEITEMTRYLNEKYYRFEP